MVNKVILVGRLGKDPEVRHLENNSVVANFSLATSEVYRDKQGNKVEQTEWHNIVVWRRLAEIAEKFLRKGSMIYIEGKIRSRSWDDKEGNKRYTTEIVADNFQMLDKASDRGEGGMDNQGASAAQASQPQTVSDSSPGEGGNTNDDDLPF